MTDSENARIKRALDVLRNAPFSRVVNAFVSMTMGFRGVATPTKRNIVARFRDSHAFNGVPESWWNEQFPGLI